MAAMDRIERQRTHLQRRKVSAAIKLERIQRYEGEESVKEEVVLELEKEYVTTQRLLAELESSAEARKRREIQTLRRFGVTDVNVRYSLPDIEISFIAPADTVSSQEGSQLEDNRDTEEEEESAADYGNKNNKARPAWKKLGWLTGSPLFRRRSGSESSAGRKYRAISADVVALPSTTVQNLRRLYTGKSEFYDADVGTDECSSSNNGGKLSGKRNKSPSPTREEDHCQSIDPATMAEITRFETLIKDFFRRKHHRRN